MKYLYFIALALIFSPIANLFSMEDVKIDSDMLCLIQPEARGFTSTHIKSLEGRAGNELRELAAETQQLKNCVSRIFKACKEKAHHLLGKCYNVQGHYQAHLPDLKKRLAHIEAELIKIQNIQI